MWSSEGLHLFSLWGIPVRFSPYYLFLVLMFASAYGGLADGAVAVALVTFSIVVHEMGHGLVAKYFRLSPHITIHGWGGLCFHERPERALDDALITAAGPFANFVLGGLVIATQFVLGDAYLAQTPELAYWLSALVFWNLIWGFVNLVPLWPMDGGQLFRLGMVRVFGGATGEKVTHYLGAGLGIFVAIISFRSEHPFFGVITGYWAWMNIQRINNPGASGAIYTTNRFAKDLGKKMVAAYEAGQVDEAYRLGQQIRSEKNIDSRTLSRVWEVLGVVEALRDNYEDAWSYLKRAPERGRVLEARAACIIALQMRSEAQAFVQANKHTQIPERLRDQIVGLAA